MFLINLSKSISCALGALGRRFESCRPDFSKPSYTSELPRLAFLLDNYEGITIRQKSVKTEFIEE